MQREIMLFALKINQMNTRSNIKHAWKNCNKFFVYPLKVKLLSPLPTPSSRLPLLLAFET